MNIALQNDTEMIAIPLPDQFSSIHNWSREATGDWARDNALGRQRAGELRAYIQMSGNFPALAVVTEMIATHGHFGGIEAGFFQRVSELMAR